MTTTIRTHKTDAEVLAAFRADGWDITVDGEVVTVRFGKVTNITTIANIRKTLS